MAPSCTTTPASAASCSSSRAATTASPIPRIAPRPSPPAATGSSAFSPEERLMVTRDRLRDEFLDLVRISSVSRREGEVARRLTTILEGMGAAVEVDDAGPKVGSDTGNLVARFPGSAPDAAPFLLCGHMDTVPPGDNVKPVVDGDVIRSDGTTVLGGDDKSGIVAILEAIRLLRERRVPHGPVEVLLTICEEMGLLGAKQFDVGRLRARTGLILDCDGVHELITRAPAADRMQFTVHGLEAHAGLAPEQ